MLSLISTGERRAIASRGDYAARGRWAWYWKDWIDRRFVRRFRVSGVPRRAPRWHVSSPSGGELVAASGGELLAMVLERAGVTPGAAVRRPVVNALEVQSIGGLRAPGDDPHHMGRIAAEHALNDIYALGGSPRTALGWVTVPAAGIDQMAGDLEQFVGGAMLAFEPAGVEWVGGHFVAGPDYCAGFAVTGTAHEDDLWTWQRIAIDDVLILTKSIGTGILLGADARAHCRGDWLRSVLDSMCASNLPALPVLRDAGVRAAAHVSEGGLLGQAVRMAQAARLCIEILPARVPLFDGVEACGSPAGRPASDRALSDIDRGPYAPEDIRVTSLLDPQLSGGLLAAVRPEQVVACIANLRTAGFRHAAIIGRVVAARDDGLACSLAEDPQH
jgi:selenide,water dikinase